MTKEEAAKILESKAECMRREISGTYADCNYRKCDDCDLNYAQGTMGEQREAIQVAVEALQEPKRPDSVGATDDRKLAKVLANTLDGTPLLYACNKLWSEHGWCEGHCGQHQQEPDAECWMRYAEVMAG